MLGIQFTNAFISFYETQKAGNAVAALKASLKPLATVKRDGKWSDIDATLVVPGDLVLLAAGSAVPADCYVNSGIIEVDQSAMTGESLPVKFHRGEVCKLGSNVVRGETEGTVESTGANTFFGKTASMLQSSGDEAGSLQILLMRIMIVLVTLSLTLCTIALVYLIIEGRAANEQIALEHRHTDASIIKESLSFAVVVLVASIPLAIEIVTTTTLALGSRQLSAQGAIVTRLGAIEEMAGMDMLCSDKTGTLTLNKMVIQEDCPTYSPGETYESVLFQAALAAKWKEPPRDALDTMVLKTSGQDLSKCDAYEQLDFLPFDPRVKRTEGKLRGPDGAVFWITKGAPSVVLELCHNKEEIRSSVEAKVHELGTRGIRSLALARKEDSPSCPEWRMLGILTFLDPPRPDTKDTIEKCHQYGVRVKMITGDHHVIAVETARVLGMGPRIYPSEGLPVLEEGGGIPDGLVDTYGARICPADGFASVFPEHKYLIVETLRQAGFRCGMTGDGVNDAPALKKADVGIAVQGSTDAARAAADIVLTGEGLSTIVTGIQVSREVFTRLKNFISYRIAATLQLLLFFFIAVFAFKPADYYHSSAYSSFAAKHIDLSICKDVDGHETCGAPWPTFFQLPVLMIMLLTLLNDGALISVGYDKVMPSSAPEQWNIRRLFTVATVLAVVACGSSLLLLYAALDSSNPNGIFQSMGLPPMEYGKIVTMVYLKVSLSDFLTLFSCRTQESPFWAVTPGWPLVLAVMISLTISTCLASFWPEGLLDGLPVMGLALGDYTLMPLWIWIYCVVWWLLQDAAKVFTISVLNHFNIFPNELADYAMWEEKAEKAKTKPSYDV